MAKKNPYKGSKRTRYPGITKEGDKYRVRLFVDGFQYGLGRYHTLEDARAVLSEAHSQKARGTFVPPKVRRQQLKELRDKERRQRITVTQWLEVWLESLAADPDRPRSPGTLATYRSAITVHALPVIGDLNLADVTGEDIEQIMLEARKSGQGAAYNVSRTLRAMFGAAVSVEAGGLETSPVTAAAIPKATKPRRQPGTDRTLDAAQVKALEGHMPDDLALAVTLAAWVGLRLGEVLGLQRQDFHSLDDAELARVNVARQWNTKARPPKYTAPKWESERELHLPQSVAQAVTKHLQKHVPPEPDAPLFPGRQNRRQPISQTTFDRLWREAREKVKPGMRFHDLRHTALTAYAQMGATVRELMDQGGHSDPKVAMQYQEAAARRKQELASKMDAMIAGEES